MSTKLVHMGRNPNLLAGTNTNGKFTTIYSGDGLYVANDKDRNGIVSENEIDLNM